MTEAIENSSTEHQLDLDFRMTIVKGNIKTAMKHGDGKGRSFTAGDLWWVSPKCIKVIPGYNIRVKSRSYHEKLKELEDAIFHNGFNKDSAISVIVIKDEDGGQSIYVKRGHRRLQATLGAIARGKVIDTIPCIIASDNISEEDMTADLFDSNNGELLTPYEMAVGVKRMSRFIPDDHAAIARRLGLWPAQVSDALLLINGPIEISEYVRDDVISFTLAVQILEEHGPKALQVIEQGRARAAAAGNSTEKLKPRFVPGKVIKKAVTNAAPTMRTAIQDIRQDSGFQHLTPENQQKLDAILEQFRLAEEEEEKLNVNPSTEQQLNLNTTEE
ncbi:hypothetical protein C206_02344 [Pseudomonas putida TRO1]|uniref:ParB/Sulfiredoxin domain-containing protein n=2 Tax=Pseudomonas putida TaxID=303 RepID=A0A1L7NPK6_PSEPU|nr:hypothetical protein [Pseudomonas putida]ELS0926988.1 hypothetical protein [Pseudomonas putida]ENY79397.1 hypothetical protein C206_02344 [Pseudomonas putida TRO1]BAW27374.1 Uncharacterized protein KF715C_pB2680 [Pseudomonas putida]HDS0941588.1 hypothetical protein [Pseudomonas putida]